MELTQGDDGDEIVRPIVYKKDLECPLCMQYCEPHVLQCTMGHIFCDSCYANLVAKVRNAGDAVPCPYCRMDIRTPCRNLRIENLIAGLPEHCEVPGCDMEVRRCDRKCHQENCTRRIVACTHSDLGCTWTGMALDLAEHIGVDSPACWYSVVRPAVEESRRLTARLDVATRDFSRRMRDTRKRYDARAARMEYFLKLCQNELKMRQSVPDEEPLASTTIGVDDIDKPLTDGIGVSLDCSRKASTCIVCFRLQNGLEEASIESLMRFRLRGQQNTTGVHKKLRHVFTRKQPYHCVETEVPWSTDQAASYEITLTSM